MKRDAGDARVRFRARARARISATASRTARSLARFSRTPPTSDLWTMSGERIFTTTPIPQPATGAQRRRLPRHCGPATRVRSEWNRPRAAASSRLDRARLARLPPHSRQVARHGDVRLEVLRQARRRRHQSVQRLAVVNQVHKALDRIGFGRVIRNAVGLEDWRDGFAGTDPDGENGLRTGSGCCGAPARRRRPIWPRPAWKQAQSERS